MLQLKGLLAVAGLALLGCAASDNEGSGEWQELFNGVDLTGWQRLNGDAEFVVEEGVIVGTSKRNTPNTFLATKRKYRDFILEFEFQIDPFLNSGVQIRSNSTDYQNGRVHGYQVEIDPSERGWSGGIYDESRRGWLHPLGMNPEAAKAYRKDDWNQIYVEAIGPEIRTWLNGQPAAYLIDDLTPAGFVALQIHSINRPELVGRKIRWRNIRIKTGQLERRDADFPFIANHIPNNLSEAEQQMGWMALFDGVKTSQWRGAHQEEFPTRGWKVQDGELKVLPGDGAESQNGGDIVTRDQFGAFDMQLEFKLDRGANSGIKYFVTEGYGQDNASAIGLEYQLIDDGAYSEEDLGPDGDRTLASLYDLIKPEIPDRFVNPPGQWNHARIRVDKDNTVSHWLNYIKVLEYKRGSRDFNRRVRESKYKDWKGFGMAEQGHLLLQDHGHGVSFRSIKVRNL